MIAWEQNVEAYHIVADMLVNFRRIVERGLKKCSGKDFYRDGCPPELVQRLAASKDLEAAIDRFGSEENEELITFATFEDLADLLDANEELAQLLNGLSPKDETMPERLRTLEVLRRKLAAAVPFDDDDIEVLSVFHQEFRATLAGGRARPADETLESTGEPPAEEVAPEQSVSSLRDGVAAAAEEGATDDEISYSSAKTPDTEAVAVEAAVPASEKGEPVAPPVESGESEDWGEFPPDDYITKASRLTAAPPEVGDFRASAEGAAEVALAMADNDDVGVLRALHREVTSVAEGVFAMDVDRSHEVWESVRASGWYDMKMSEFALAPLELFYAVAEEARDKKNAGVDNDDIKEFLADAHFTKLLLSLREMFLRQEL